MTANDRTTPLRPSLRRLAGALLEILQSRIELIGIELTEEKERLMGVAFLGLAAMLFGVLALVSLAALVIVIFWDTYRLQAMTGIFVVYLLLAGWCALRARNILRDAPMPFESTLAEFAKDRDALRPD
ncbi:membrane protein [Pandoraea horticolens]|uniref:Membrane protein n=1 Tax=Pandoraea horticolens TaxID=2508298 RepID=A0A5E4Y9A8_9BURK|nr:phage holin family protein [Pandoraea horticolens]VVE44997.1 membrane protein [Pandoraea horticolens]